MCLPTFINFIEKSPVFYVVISVPFPIPSKLNNILFSTDLFIPIYKYNSYTWNYMELFLKRLYLSTVTSFDLFCIPLCNLNS